MAKTFISQFDDKLEQEFIVLDKKECYFNKCREIATEPLNYQDNILCEFHREIVTQWRALYHYNERTPIEIILRQQLMYCLIKTRKFEIDDLREGYGHDSPAILILCGKKNCERPVFIFEESTIEQLIYYKEINETTDLIDVVPVYSRYKYNHYAYSLICSKCYSNKKQWVEHREKYSHILDQNNLRFNIKIVYV